MCGIPEMQRFSPARNLLRRVDKPPAQDINGVTHASPAGVQMKGGPVHQRLGSRTEGSNGECSPGVYPASMSPKTCASGACLESSSCARGGRRISRCTEHRAVRAQGHRRCREATAAVVRMRLRRELMRRKCVHLEPLELEQRAERAR